MHDLGHKFGNEMVASPSSKEKDIYYPSESFTEETLPGLAGKKAGDTVMLTIEAKVKSVEIRDIEGKNKKTEYRLEFHKGYCDESGNGSKADKIAEMGSGEKKKMYPDDE